MRVTLGLAAICALSFVLPAGAHHSHGNYTDTFKDITGVVKEVHFIVPHSWVYIEVKDASGPQLWALEATGRGGLERLGVTKEYIRSEERRVGKECRDRVWTCCCAGKDKRC